MVDLAGLSIGRYHIVEKLGAGGMATVYKAVDTRLEREVAIKLIRREAVTAENYDSMLKRFEREAKVLARLSHPNIVKVYDYGDYEGSPYLVMEYIPGGTLKQRVGRPMPYAEAARLLAPIAGALEAAHKNNLIHRDVKPANILLTLTGQPMLSDFGIAKILESDDQMHLTQTGMGVGTPDYMAPEQWMGKVTSSIDIYSLGIVFFELLTGKRPYTADTPAAILIKHINDPLPRPRNFVTDLPEEVERVVYKALAKKPEDRYQDMGSFAAALERLAVVQAGTPSLDETVAQSTAPVLQATEVAPPPATPYSSAFTASMPASPYPAPQVPASAPYYPQTATPANVPLAYQAGTASSAAPTGLTPLPVAVKKRTPWGWIAAAGIVGLLGCIGVAVLLITLINRTERGGEGQTALMVTSTSTIRPREATATDSATEIPQVSATSTEVPQPGAAVINEDVVLHIWTRDESYHSFLQNLCAKYSYIQPRVTCEVQLWEADLFTDAIVTAGAAGTMPELIVHNMEAMNLVDTGMFLPVETLVDDTSIFLPHVLDEFRNDDGLWGVPLNAGTYLTLYYNKDLIATAPTSNEELLNQAEALTSGSQSGIVYLTGNFYFINPWVGGYDASLLSDDGLAPALDTPEMINTLRFVQDLKARGMLSDCCDYSQADELFLSGNAAMMINGTWAWPYYEETLGDRLGIAPLPQVTETGLFPAPYSDLQGFLGASDLEGSRLAAAREFIAYVVKAENQLAQLQELSWLPSTQEAFYSSEVMGDPFLASLAEQATHTVPYPTSPETSCAWGALDTLMQDVINGNLTPENAAAQAQESAEECISALP